MSSLHRFSKSPGTPGLFLLRTSRWAGSFYGHLPLLRRTLLSQNVNGIREAAMQNERVRDWMTSEVVMISPNQTLPEAHALMKGHKIRRLPVVDGGELIGILTLGDLREASPSDATSLSVFEMNYLLGRLPVSKIMTRDPLTVSPASGLIA